MQPLDFYKLARPIQERFIGSVNGTGLPTPILRAPAKPKEPRLWAGACAGSALVLLLVFRAGMGDLDSALAIQGFVWLVMYAALVSLFVFGALRAFAVLREHRKSPFRRGVYVFPVGLIDARTPDLRVYPIEDLSALDGPDAAGMLRLSFGAASFPFPVKDSAQAEEAKRELDGAKGRVSEADGARESIRPKALAALDPLQGFANPLVGEVPIERFVPAWARLAWAFALGVGVVIGPSFYLVHNALSDDEMYDRAAAANDVASLQSYLAKGSRHAAVVSLQLLPRAELEEAKKTGSVEAIQKFITNHPQTAIGPEMTAALKAALSDNLAEAKKAGTLSALDAFAHKFPDSRLDAEIKAARHTVYQAAIAKFEAASAGKSANEFVERLVAFAEKKGPPVEVRFHREESKSLDKADGHVGKSRLFRGVASMPSHYFNPPHMKPRQDALAQATIAKFAEAFPSEILALAVGEPIANPSAHLPANVSVPTLFIEHVVEWPGSQVTSKDPRGIFVGLGFTFEATFRIPEDPKPMKIKLGLWRSPDTSAAKGDDKPEEIIYGKMAEDAFAQFQKKLAGTFFKAVK